MPVDSPASQPLEALFAGYALFVELVEHLLHADDVAQVFGKATDHPQGGFLGLGCQGQNQGGAQAGNGESDQGFHGCLARWG